MLKDLINELKHNDWRNFFAWSRRVKLCVVLFCAFIAWLLCFLLINMGQYSDLSTAQLQETTLKQALAITIPSIATQQLEKSQLKQIEQWIQQQNRQLPHFDQLGSILDDITQASTNNRLNLVLLKPDPILTVAPYNKVPIEVEINGNYAALTNFLSQLAHLPYNLYPRQLTLAAPDNNKPTETDTLASNDLHLKMVIDMYYLPPSQHVKN